MFRHKTVLLVLFLGLAIGIAVPYALPKWPGALQKMEQVVTTGAKGDQKATYHFVLRQGILSVVERKPAEGEKEIITGLNVQNWPPNILEMAPKLEFRSFDEIQSFIDTVSEPMIWSE